MKLNTILVGQVLDRLKELPDKSVDCVVTSPPYYALRDYGVKGQIGLEKTPEAFIRKLVKVFREVRRVLKDEGTLWVNMGDSYASSGKNRTEEQATTKSGLNGGLKTQMASLKQQSKLTAGLKSKDLIGVPWMLAFALRKDGWYLRQDIIWAKPNPMPESVTDRCGKAHEYLFLLSKSPRYRFDNNAIMEPIAAASVARLQQNVEAQKGSDRVPGKTNGRMKAVYAKGNRKTFRGGGVYTGGKSFDNSAIVESSSKGNTPAESLVRNKRSVWTVATMPFKEAHFATFPEELIVDCIKAGCPPGGVVLDPFFGVGTTGLVAKKLGRNYIGIELNPAYVKIAEKRLKDELGMFYQTQEKTA